MGAIPYVLFFASMLRTCIGEPPPVKLETIYPIQFTEVTSQAYVYSHILTQTYEEPYVLNEKELTRLVDEAFSVPSQCTDRFNNCENVTRHIQTLQQNTKELVLREARSVLFELKNNNIRSKRGLGHWFGTVFQSWCDVALLDDVGELLKNDTQLNARIEGLEMLFLSQNDILMNFTSIVRKEMVRNLQELVKVEDEGMMRSIMRNQLTHLIFHYNKIQDACNRRMIAINSIDASILRDDLSIIQSALEMSDLALAVPIEKIEDYYKLRICTCEFVDNAIRISIRLPVRHKRSTYKIYSPIYLPFKFGNQICSVQAQDAIVLHNTETDEVRVSTAQYLKDCDLSTHLCKLHPNYNPSTDAICLQETFSNRSIEEVRELCPFVCISLPPNVPMVNSLGSERYVVTNMPQDSFIMNSTDGLVPLPYSPDQNGAFQLDLPCASRLVHYVPENGSSMAVRILIDRVVPCSTENLARTHVLQPVIPLQWLSNVSFADVTLNDEWKNIIPNYSFSTKISVHPHPPIVYVKEESGFSQSINRIVDFVTFDLLHYGSPLCLVALGSYLVYRVRILKTKIRRVEELLFMRQGHTPFELPVRYNYRSADRR